MEAERRKRLLLACPLDHGLLAEPADMHEPQVELVPGGGEIPVTNANRVEFIRLISNYRLNTQLKVATEAFKRGFSHLIHPAWVTMFNGEELQKLISGGAALGLDLDDLRHHVVYASGYADDHPVIQTFWQVGGSLVVCSCTELLVAQTCIQPAKQARAACLRKTACRRPHFNAYGPGIGILAAC